MSDLLAAPIGRYVAGMSFVLAVQDARIAMIHTTPALAPADVADLLRGAALPTHDALGASYDILHDAAGIRGVDPEAYALLVAWLGSWIDQFAHRVRRLAVVHPDGIAGAAFVGLFHDWIAPRFDSLLCETRADAYGFLGVDHESRDELDHLARQVGDPMLRSLREALASDPRAPSIEVIARRIGTSTRSLQRALTAHGTTFRGEVDDARIRIARTRLADTDLEIEAIAREVGLANLATFVRWFERIAAEHPLVFRARVRGPR